MCYLYPTAWYIYHSHSFIFCNCFVLVRLHWGLIWHLVYTLHGQSIWTPDHQTHVWSFPNCCDKFEGAQLYTRQSLYAVALWFTYTGTKGSKSTSAQSKVHEDMACQSWYGRMSGLLWDKLKCWLCHMLPHQSSAWPYYCFCGWMGKCPKSCSKI